MDWPLAIKRNRDALQRIVAALFVMVGFVEGGALVTLPRHLYNAVMLIVRPAEAAIRRLVIIAARGLVVVPRPSGTVPSGLAPSSSSARLAAFPLIDPLERFNDGAAFEPAALPPRISVPGFSNPLFVSSPVPYFDEPVNAEQLVRRLQALKRALENLSKQARRLARWRARRDAILTAKEQARAVRLSPFRPGWPPGYRKRQVHEVDQVLLECHALALYANSS